MVGQVGTIVIWNSYLGYLVMIGADVCCSPAAQMATLISCGVLSRRWMHVGLSHEKYWLKLIVKVAVLVEPFQGPY